MFGWPQHRSTTALAYLPEQLVWYGIVALLPFGLFFSLRRDALLTTAGTLNRQPGGPAVRVPLEMDRGHVYHLFPVRTTRRPALQAHLRSAGIETLVHYPVPIPRQPAFASAAPARCPVAEAAADEVLSLPLHPALLEADVRSVAAAIRDFPEQG